MLVKGSFRRLAPFALKKSIFNGCDVLLTLPVSSVSLHAFRLLFLSDFLIFFAQELILVHANESVNGKVSVHDLFSQVGSGVAKDLVKGFELV